MCGSLVVDYNTESCDVLFVELEDWEDSIISNEIIGVVSELLKYFSSCTCTTLILELIEDLSCVFMIVRQFNFSSYRLGHVSIMCGSM